jgi:aryl-alcohol dehydrogenase-like predicted oxidoreductase
MNRRPLGKTGIEVSELAMGGLFVASFAAEFETARRTLRRALDLGINYVDTAPGYQNSEEVIGRALAGVDQPFVLSTKLGGRPTPFEAKNVDHLERSFEESLRLLKRDSVDILMIHEPDRPGQYDWWIPGDAVEGPVLDFLERMKQAGAVKFTGIGGTTAYEMVRYIESGHFDVVLTAFNYSLLWREAELEVLPAAKKQGIGVIIGSPLQQGALARRFDEEIDGGAPWLSSPRRRQYRKLYALLDDLGMSVSDLAMRFVISNPDISCTLSGSRSVEELEANVAAVEAGPLPSDVLARIDEIAAEVPFRPFEEPFGLPFGREYRGPGRA